MKPNHIFYIFFLITLLFVGGCGIFDSNQPIDNTGSIFGRWELEEIRYDNGNTLTPEAAAPYWFELKKDSVFAEQEYHYSLTGQSNCNPCLGYFDVDEEAQEINISFICERLVCGIASKFSVTVATSDSYSYKEGKLLLHFEAIPEFMNAGVVILNPNVNQSVN